MDGSPEQPDQPSPRTRIAIVLSHGGVVTAVYCDGTDTPLDVVITTRRKDGELTGRPVTTLATPDAVLVGAAFQRADSPIGNASLARDYPHSALVEELANRQLSALRSARTKS